MLQVRPLPEKFGRCHKCDATIIPGHMVVLFATILMCPKGTEGPDNLIHTCDKCAQYPQWESEFDARYPGMWDVRRMMVTSKTGDLPEDL